jgi:hypothetical protein
METGGRMRVIGIVLAAMLTAPFVVAQQAARGGAAPFRIEPLTTPAGEDSLAPQMTDEGSRVVLSWVEAHEEHATVKLAFRSASGWSAAETVVSGDFLMVNPADVPVVGALPDGTLVAAWLRVNGGDDESYDLAVSRSANLGRTWSAPLTPHHDGTKTQHGFASLYPAPSQRGGFGLLWLDGRATAGGGSMALRSAEFDAKGVQRGETAVDARVCDCCPLSTATTAEGPIVAYRDRSADEIRDIAVSRLSAGSWTPPKIVGGDGWKIAGCPVNGPSVSASGAIVAVAWFTGAGGSGRALAAFSSDSGKTFGTPVRVDEGTAIGRVQIRVLKDGSAAVSWIESFESRSQLRLRQIDRNGVKSASIVVAEGMGTAHPRLARDGDGLLLAWVESSRGSTRVRTARAVPLR